MSSDTSSRTYASLRNLKMIYHYLMMERKKKYLEYVYFIKVGLSFNSFNYSHIIRQNTFVTNTFKLNTHIKINTFDIRNRISFGIEISKNLV